MSVKYKAGEILLVRGAHRASYQGTTGTEGSIFVMFLDTKEPFDMRVVALTDVKRERESVHGDN